MQIQAASRVFAVYRANAKKRGTPFAVPFAFFAELLFRDCIYCGSPPSNLFTVARPRPGQVARTMLYQGLDRLDPSRGYTAKNLVPCCFECNQIKSNVLTPAEMLQVAKALNKFRKKRLRTFRR